MRDDRRRIFLKVVRRQPVVFGADEGFEEAPGAPRDQSRKLRVFRAQQFSFGGSRFADPVSNQWRE